MPTRESTADTRRTIPHMAFRRSPRVANPPRPPANVLYFREGATGLGVPGSVAPSAGGIPWGRLRGWDMTLRQFQELIEAMYSAKDRQRGSAATFLWLSEEVGELAAALRQGTPHEKADEFADVLAWLATLANVEGIDLTEAVKRKYGSGCPGCGRLICTCDEKP